MTTIRLTAAQALVRWLCAQYVVVDGAEVPYFAGAWAIFGHGNVAAMGEALYAARDALPTFRAHNEQGMAHAAVAYAKQMRRRRAMVCTTSIGPGATNLVTAAALAHVNRLPVLFVPGDVYASRRPDPVLQQVEDFGDGTVSANDCFRPVSRWFDRIVRPEQLLDALPKVLATLLDPANCGPVTLAFCQDVQAEAFDYPLSFFERRIWTQRRPPADPRELDALEAALRVAKRPLLVSGGGVLYSQAETALAVLAEATGLPVAETQAGKGALPWTHPCALGSIGVTGSSAANAMAQEADLVVGIGTRLQDFTTGSRSLFEGKRLFQVNVQSFDAHKHGATAVVGDALTVVEALRERLQGWRVAGEVVERDRTAVVAWNADVVVATSGEAGKALPSDAQVIGAVQGSFGDDVVVVCAAGGLPGELHKLWRTARPGGYHLEYGYSCMGYEIAGGVGVKMAEPQREVVVMVGDGSYLMLNSELATSVMLGLKLVVVLLDNRGYGCINRLQQATGSPGFNNLLADARHAALPDIDFAAHARSLGALAEHVATLGELQAALQRARAAERSTVVVIDTDPLKTTEAGGWWWDVAVPEVSDRPEVNAARRDYEQRVRMKRDLS
ncbi:3D-(3,5/4)-trihydroxycyclohexane-1,2-dione acylhydrolase (decyclizing) [Pseudoxanthomonas sangjuensis]|uniref:3D-(3,5/4)-trihydroxycyclohexane-1,2-dione acylhydrolase (decyclizing) n=1 Tax=Pseudoxanthomonas sangjuensis TaxID=1503750 RepID=UPI001391A810|nr:3D-(3,5/4)-trihydroxycyclohexane-1,2-dione acylhydrolase (decyclizing) [Pseudoxanthomonas sangjuensis]KAF1715055.1 3D-(3,5/4)-trihydroxycyclohexane-1,2-dione acylhydrolase (decyclizing) [Pseudoxanthomonas sangjuensis]